jgi:hypothetical protein
MMQQGSPDAAAARRLLVEIQNLQGSMAKTHDSFSAQAANTLTADQKAKLKNLQDALALMPAIHEASAAGLLAPPAGGAASATRFHGGPGGPRWHGAPPNN